MFKNKSTINLNIVIVIKKSNLLIAHKCRQKQRFINCDTKRTLLHNQ